MYQPVQLGLAAPDGHFQGVQGQVGAQRPGGPPAHDEAAEGIDDQGHVHEAGPAGYIGQIRDPQLVRSGRREVSLDQVSRPGGGRIGRGGPAGLATHGAAQP